MAILAEGVDPFLAHLDPIGHIAGDMLPLLLIVGVVALFGLAIFLYSWFEQRRSRALEKIADSLDYGFSRGDELSLLARLGHRFDLFGEGYSKRVSNVLHGEANGVWVTVFDYEYCTGRGRTAQTSLQTVVLFEEEGAELPKFTLCPENILHKISGMFGYQDIDLAEHPDFSSKYLLRGEDEAAIRKVFGDWLPKYYVQRSGLNTEAAGDYLLYYRASRRVPPVEIKTFIQEGLAVFELLKSCA